MIRRNARSVGEWGWVSRYEWVLRRYVSVWHQKLAHSHRLHSHMPACACLCAGHEAEAHTGTHSCTQPRSHAATQPPHSHTAAQCMHSSYPHALDASILTRAQSA